MINGSIYYHIRCPYDEFQKAYTNYVYYCPGVDIQIDMMFILNYISFQIKKKMKKKVFLKYFLIRF